MEKNLDYWKWKIYTDRLMKLTQEKVLKFQFFKKKPKKKRETQNGNYNIVSLLAK